MKWPFTRKESEYNKLRKSVGMSPARDDDCAEAIAWVAVFELHQPDVLAECQRHPVEERSLFMMAYATHVKRLAMTGVEAMFPPNSWPLIFPLIDREFSKQNWYQPDVMARLWDSIIQLPLAAQGKYTGASSGPWTVAVLAANMAGYKLSYSTNLEFMITVGVTSTKMLETISKMKPAG